MPTSRARPTSQGVRARKLGTSEPAAGAFRMQSYRPALEPGRDKRAVDTASTHLWRPEMTLWQKLFSRKPEPGKRVRVCVECGMPVAEHKDWCSIFRTQQEYDRKAAAAKAQ